MFCYAQCNNGALLYELFCCIKSIKKTFDEQRVLPSFSCNVEAVLRNEEIYEADLWYKELSGDIERFELLGVAPAMKRSIAVADCLSHFNDGQQITVLTKLVFHVFSEAGSFLFGQPRQFIPIGDTRIVMTRPFLIPAIRCAIDFRVKLPVNQIEDYIVGTDCVPASFLARIFARD